ncbi:MAG: sulfite reductase subunit C, partial [Clostridium perfringens]|nr:sulfite reductase subunit C [Clostridium perfringens]
LNPEALVAENIYWAETEYRSNINVKPIGKHKTIESNREVQD